ncbi:RNA-binding protein Nova-1 [Portunus trituberculatus]|uniref:RNA-binding protein Nova-1 n=1 Tax=Portunus trituberculatus TaxID=210409 RepID=A0A5B7DTG2_PORTR|nr:RNA-binding protein Nova-1 [Portunus trituberculatus]
MTLRQTDPMLDDIYVSILYRSGILVAQEGLKREFQCWNRISRSAHSLQVKILVPNSTAGMIIGKGGTYIKQIKEESGAYVQISQKAKDQSLAERCITVECRHTSSKNTK